MGSLDYATFAHPAFDANEYANAILAAQPYRIPNTSNQLESGFKTTGLIEGGNKEEISVALAKLSFGIDDVNRQLKNVINAHHEGLLSRAASVNQLEGNLLQVNAGLKDISGSVNRLRSKLSIPYGALQAHVARLQKLQVASDVLRRVSRFFMISRRLEAQMAALEQASTSNMNVSKPTTPASPTNGSSTPTTASISGVIEGNEAVDKERERTIIKAALSIAEIYALIDAESQQSKQSDNPEATNDDLPSISLRSITAVSSHLSNVQTARERIMNEMEAMLVTGVQELNRPLLSSALLTASNLRVLPETVQSIVTDLVEVAENRIKEAFDMAALGREKGLKETSAVTSAASNLLYKSRVRTEPTNLTAPQWTNAFWTRLENMISHLSEACIKVYTLEKVLSLQREAASERTFLDAAMTVLENKPSSIYWSTVARMLERSCRDGAKGSSFLTQTLTSQYPKLLRLFQDFFSRISVHTDTTYTQSYQSPETVLTLRAVSTFEAAYLQRSTNRLNELISSTFATSASAYYGGGTYVTGGGYMASSQSSSRPPPNEKEGVAIARVVANELDTAKFDPLLVKACARGVVTSLDMMCTRVENLAAKDRNAVTLIGPNSTIQQMLNAALVNSVYHCWLQLSKIPDSYSDAVLKILEPAVSALQATYLKITDPLMNAIRLDTSAILARVHRLSFADDGVDPISRGGEGSSPYLKELAEKLMFIRLEVLSKYNVGELGQEWTLEIARHILKTFILHLSIIKPLGEAGKLQLIPDMTGLEFALNTLLFEGVAQGTTKPKWRLDVLGHDYYALRSLRQLIFLDDNDLAKPERTGDSPPLIVLHHILVRSPLPLPHKLHGWQETQYVRFIEEHTSEEIWSVLEQGLKHWRTTILSDIEDAEDAGPAGLAKKQEKEKELAAGDAYVRLATKVLQNARTGRVRPGI
ncbi:Conserved oligomeric Golgi complex subunit 5 Short=COG complex subunit 5; AltName: Full=Component of oligomeric Golgi complex 5 [Serendipita indica DSM 11827]|nr:Conserved oligomeric Golgi complex subunit 5 Short=COG complex subunit 5; AltName: Full=Component of oligomeric Golgi complex 5 [Serendipita indica DSM 11827]